MTAPQSKASLVREHMAAGRWAEAVRPAREGLRPPLGIVSGPGGVNMGKVAFVIRAFQRLDARLAF